MASLAGTEKKLTAHIQRQRGEAPPPPKSSNTSLKLGPRDQPRDSWGARIWAQNCSVVSIPLGGEWGGSGSRISRGTERNGTACLTPITRLFQSRNFGQWSKVHGNHHRYHEKSRGHNRNVTNAIFGNKQLGAMILECVLLQPLSGNAHFLTHVNTTPCLGLHDIPLSTR